MPKPKSSISKKISLLFSTLLCSLAVLSLIVNLLWPDRAFSVVENRPLSRFPAPSLASLQSGQWQKGVTDWFSDQFIGRDAWFHIHYLMSKMTGIQKIEDVYLGQNCLIQQAPSMDEEMMLHKARAINAFYSVYPLETMVLIAPTAEWIEKSRLPRFVEPLNQEEALRFLFDQLGPKIEMPDLNAHMEEYASYYLYYRTDHHWTSLGAWQAARIILESQKIETSLDQYDCYPVSSGFRGTLASRTGSLFLKDTIDLYVAKDNPDYLVVYNNDGIRLPTIYDDEALERKDQYEVFFGGNDALVQITTQSSSDRHLLIFKDSYANSVIQFLLPYYRSITMVDPRYYYDDLTRLMSSSMITDVLYLYSYSTFQTDRALMDVLESAVQIKSSQNAQV